MEEKGKQSSSKRSKGVESFLDKEVYERGGTTKPKTVLVGNEKLIELKKKIMKQGTVSGEGAAVHEILQYFGIS